MLKVGVERSAGLGVGVPQESVGDFVAHLYPTRLHAGCFHSLDYALGVIIDGALYLLCRVGAPCARLALLSGVGPIVAVVEIEHHVHAGFAGAHCLCHHIGCAVVALIGVYPHAQAYGIHA